MPGSIFTYEEVLGVDFAMLWQVEVLLRDEHALAEQVLVNLLAVFLGNQPESMLVMSRRHIQWIRAYILTVVLRSSRVVFKSCCGL